MKQWAGEGGGGEEEGKVTQNWSLANKLYGHKLKHMIT